MCRLVRSFLKAGVLSEGAFERTETGTPQGGVLSPLLANITLAAIEERYARFIAPRRKRDGGEYARPGDAIRKYRHSERKAGRPVFLPIRYADDFVVLVTGTEDQARNEKEELATFLADELKLTLSPEKTHVTPLTEGFIFLGHRVRLRWDDRWGYWPRLEIPRTGTKDLCRRVKALTTRAHRNLPLREVIAALNPLPGLGPLLSALPRRKGRILAHRPSCVGTGLAVVAQEVPLHLPPGGSIADTGIACRIETEVNGRITGHWPSSPISRSSATV